MFAYDVNGDGLNDVITSINAHGYGLAWYELDVTWLQIRFLQLLGIARSVKVAKVTERIVEQEAA